MRMRLTGFDEKNLSLKKPPILAAIKIKNQTHPDPEIFNITTCSKVYLYNHDIPYQHSRVDANQHVPSRPA
jgi:hypothetical protein